MARVIIVGSGIAGLATALHASDTHDVVLVTKGELADSTTRYAQGGIAAATALDDSATLHAEDTIRAGAGLTDPAAALVLAEAGPAAIQSLIEWGVRFDHDEGGLEPARALEAAHSRARVLHAGGDATGAAIEEALVSALRETSVVVHEHTLLTDLVLSHASDGTGGGGIRARSVHPLPLEQAPMYQKCADAAGVTGIEVLRANGTREVLTADAVVLATGGAGQLFSHTTNPLVATGDGLAAALRAGVATCDLEFVQFHPTTLAAPGNFLISEAVRGEGAVLRNSAGERFMLGVHPDAELAPRDVVARAIASEMARQGGAPVLLDARGIDRDTLASRFPTIMAACAEAGLDLADGLIPVVPAAHYLMGGITTDLDGRTSLPGLFAVGEVARTGVHGANRLASNSLLEGAVFARRVAAALPMAGRDAAQGSLSLSKGGPGDQRSGRSSMLDRGQLQDLMWRDAGLMRSGAGLAAAAALLADWAQASTVRPNNRDDIETANLLTVARAVVAAGQARRDSRGAHARSDSANPEPNSPRQDTAEPAASTTGRPLQTQGS